MGTADLREALDVGQRKAPRLPRPAERLSDAGWSLHALVFAYAGSLSSVRATAICAARSALASNSARLAWTARPPVRRSTSLRRYGVSPPPRMPSASARATARPTASATSSAGSAHCSGGGLATSSALMSPTRSSAREIAGGGGGRLCPARTAGVPRAGAPPAPPPADAAGRLHANAERVRDR